MHQKNHPQNTNLVPVLQLLVAHDAQRDVHLRQDLCLLKVLRRWGAGIPPPLAPLGMGGGDTHTNALHKIASLHPRENNTHNSLGNTHQHHAISIMLPLGNTHQCHAIACWATPTNAMPYHAGQHPPISCACHHQYSTWLGCILLLLM